MRRVPGVPVVLRAEGVGRGGDCLWQLDAPCGRRIKRQCMDAAGFVAPTRAAQRELEAAGYPRSKIVYLPYGVAAAPPRTPWSRAAARAMWAETHPALLLPEQAFLAVVMTRRLTSPWLDRLLAVWQSLAGPLPRARLWLVGPAENRAGVQQQIDRLQLTGRVVLAGVFDQVDELLAAADLLLAPSPDGAPVALLEAMAAGLPSLAADTTANRSVLADGQEGLLLAADDADALAAGVTRLYHEPELAARMGYAARARAQAEFSLARMADQHVTWFQQLCAERESSTSSRRWTARRRKADDPAGRRAAARVSSTSTSAPSRAADPARLNCGRPALRSP